MLHVNDRDLVFSRFFWTELFHQFGIMLRLGSTFRLQIDRHSEVNNRILDVFLRCLAVDRPQSWCGGCHGPSFATTCPSKQHSRWHHSKRCIVSHRLGLTQVATLDKQLTDRDEFLAVVREWLLQA